MNIFNWFDYYIIEITPIYNKPCQMCENPIKHGCFVIPVKTLDLKYTIIKTKSKNLQLNLNVYKCPFSIHPILDMRSRIFKTKKECINHFNKMKNIWIKDLYKNTVYN